MKKSTLLSLRSRGKRFTKVINPEALFIFAITAATEPVALDQTTVALRTQPETTNWKYAAH